MENEYDLIKLIVQEYENIQTNLHLSLDSQAKVIKAVSVMISIKTNITKGSHLQIALNRYCVNYPQEMNNQNRISIVYEVSKDF